MNENFEFSRKDLDDFIQSKYGPEESMGWRPKQRIFFNYFKASDIYELVLDKIVTKSSRWIDVGGGRALIPHNPRLSSLLSERCEELVAVDPSDNVKENPYCDSYNQCLLEDFPHKNENFNLATFRMVVEHVQNPSSLVEKLNEILEINGIVIVYTINKYSLVPIITKYTPFSWHFPLKKMLWGGEEKDTFPVAYKMNTRNDLKNFFEQHGFLEEHFRFVDDIAIFSGIKYLNFLELAIWKTFNMLGIQYPEKNILAAYRKIR